MTRKAERHLLVLEQMVERGNQFARGQVAAGAEDDDGARLDQACEFRRGGNRRRWLVHFDSRPDNG